MDQEEQITQASSSTNNRTDPEIMIIQEIPGLHRFSMTCCGNTYFKKGGYRSHRNRKHRNIIKCIICDKEMVKARLRKHYLNDHRITKEYMLVYTEKTMRYCFNPDFLTK